MKTILAGALLLLTCSYGYAQPEEYKGRFALKLYNITSWERQEYTYSNPGGNITTFRMYDFQLAHPAFALQFADKRGNAHELELTQLSLGSKEETSDIFDPISGKTIPMTSGEEIRTDIAIRYEYIINLLRKNKSRWRPAIGLGVSPYLKRSAFTPGDGFNTTFPVTSVQAGIRGWIVPRLNVLLGSRLFLDVNVPFCIADASQQWSNQSNPNMSREEQKTTTTSFDALPSLYGFRLGMGLKI